MKIFSSPNDTWQSRTLWLGSVGAAVAVLGFAVIEILALTLSVSRAAVVLASVFVSVLVGRYNVRIPRTQITFSTKDIFGFWGVIWLGVSGGILLGACASIASQYGASPDRRRLTSEV